MLTAVLGATPRCERLLRRRRRPARPRRRVEPSWRGAGRARVSSWCTADAGPPSTRSSWVARSPSTSTRARSDARGARSRRRNRQRHFCVARAGRARGRRSDERAVGLMHMRGNPQTMQQDPITTTWSPKSRLFLLDRLDGTRHRGHRPRPHRASTPASASARRRRQPRTDRAQRELSHSASAARGLVAQGTLARSGVDGAAGRRRQRARVGGQRRRRVLAASAARASSASTTSPRRSRPSRLAGGLGAPIIPAHHRQPTESSMSRTISAPTASAARSAGADHARLHAAPRPCGRQVLRGDRRARPGADRQGHAHLRLHDRVGARGRLRVGRRRHRPHRAAADAGRRLPHARAPARPRRRHRARTTRSTTTASSSFPPAATSCPTPGSATSRPRWTSRRSASARPNSAGAPARRRARPLRRVLQEHLQQRAVAAGSHMVVDGRTGRPTTSRPTSSTSSVPRSRRSAAARRLQHQRRFGATAPRRWSRPCARRRRLRHRPRRRRRSRADRRQRRPPLRRRRAALRPRRRSPAAKAWPCPASSAR